MVYMFCNDHSFYILNRTMKNISSTQVAMSDISSLKSQLGLDHEALRIDKDNYFDTTFVGVKYLNTYYQKERYVHCERNREQVPLTLHKE